MLNLLVASVIQSFSALVSLIPLTFQEVKFIPFLFQYFSNVLDHIVFNAIEIYQISAQLIKNLAKIDPFCVPRSQIHSLSP